MGARHWVQRAVLATPTRRVFQPGFVITGTGRSGTRYLAELLRACGIRAGHEQWWTLGNRSMRLDGDVSWIAAWQLDGYEGAVFHQIRNPLHIIDSMIRVRERFAGQPTRFPTIDQTGDPVVDATELVARRLRQAEQVSEWTWRVEDIDAALLATICRRSGHPEAAERAEVAIASVPAGTGSKVPRLRIEWSQVPESRHKTDVMAMARRYGYL